MYVCILVLMLSGFVVGRAYCVVLFEYWKKRSLFGEHVKKDPRGVVQNKVSELIISRLFTVKNIQTSTDGSASKRGRKMNNQQARHQRAFTKQAHKKRREREKKNNRGCVNPYLFIGIQAQQ
jgi:hypothetical protein